jgi:hypothetical protein
VKKRVAATLALALTIAIAVLVLYLAPVHLLTPGPADQIISSSVYNTYGTDGCVSMPHEFKLVADATYGTAFVDGDATPLPVVWHSGFTGRRSGSEVQVVDPQGNVVAVTGHVYVFNGGYVVRNGSNQSTHDFDFDWSGLPVPRAFFSCGRLTPQP